LYPSDGHTWGVVQPDRIAEYLLAAVCAEGSDLLPRLVTGATDTSQVLTLLRSVSAARSQLSFGNPVEHLLAQIERTAGLPVISDETLAWAVTNAHLLPGAGRRRDVEELPDGSLRFSGRLDRAIAALTVVGHRRQADGQVRDDPRQAGYGYMLLSAAQEQLSRYDEALAATDQAIACFRAAPEATEEVALELSRRAHILTILKRPEEAVDALRESVASHSTPESIDLLIQHLVRLGRLPEAVAYADQEIALLRGQATDTRAAAILGRAFGRKGELLLDLGDAPAALAALAEAAAIFDRSPAEHLPDRALVLAARASGLDQTGDVSGALAAWVAAAATWRAQPDSGERRRRLAMCLNNAAACHVRLRDLPSALAAQEEAAEVVTSLREQHHDLYTTVYANLVRYQAHSEPARALPAARVLVAEPSLPPTVGWDLYRAAESLGAKGRFTEAVEACELALRAAGDDVLIRAAVLKEMSADLADLGRYTEGADAAAAGAGAWRIALAEAGRADESELRVNLVTTMVNRAANLHAAGRLAEAAATYAEAAAELRPFAAQPEWHTLLANILYSEATVREEAEDLAAAVPVLRELTDLHRAHAHPEQAMASARAQLALGRVLFKLRRFDEALPAASESVGTLHRMLGDEPARYVPEYASAFFVLGSCLVYMNRPVAAVAPLVRALAMAAAAEDRANADAAMAALEIARSQNPEAVQAEWRRLTGLPFPGEPTRRFRPRSEEGGG
jgi:tetratricopeptide (TPR) repeat protein